MTEILAPAVIIALSLFLASRRFKEESRGMGYAWLACALLNAFYLGWMLLRTPEF